MSKKILLPFLLLFIAGSAFAQFDYGVKAGVNITKEKFKSENYKSSFQPGFHAGLIARYVLAEQIRLQAELLYSAEGSKEENTMGTKGNIKRGYIQLPVLVQYLIAKNIYAETGPMLSYMLSAKEKFGGSDYNDILRYYHKVNMRWAIAAGYSLTSAIILNARYNFSLSPINKEMVGADKIRSQAIQLGLIYLLDK